jgi:two-component system, OmpR family, response regulator
MTTLMIVDDDIDICELLQQFLEPFNYHVLTAHSGHEMFALLKKNTVDLFILDLMLPGDDGLTLCRKLRQQYATPILILSAAGEETDRIIGLEVGADDYLAKPFNPRELLARVKAILRRSKGSLPPTPTQSPKKTNCYQFGHWTLNCDTHALSDADQQQVELSSGEFKLLEVFIKRPQKVLTRDFLLDITKDRNSSPFDRSIDMHISRLRQKIEENPRQPQLIKTIRGGGYLLTSKVTRC